MGLHTEKPADITTGVATTAVTKHRFISFADAMCATAGMLVKGVSGEEDAVSGNPFAIKMGGTVLVETGVALTAGQKVMTSATGTAIVATAGNHVAGVVVRAQATIGQLVEIKQSTAPILA